MSKINHKREDVIAKGRQQENRNRLVERWRKTCLATVYGERFELGKIEEMASGAWQEDAAAAALRERYGYSCLGCEECSYNGGKTRNV